MFCSLYLISALSFIIFVRLQLSSLFPVQPLPCVGVRSNPAGGSFSGRGLTLGVLRSAAGGSA